MKALVVLCVALLVVSGHPHVFHETPVVKRVHQPLPGHVHMLPLPSYAAPEVFTLEQPEDHYTPQPPVVYEQPYGYGLRMPEEQYVTPCPKHRRIFSNSAPVRIHFGNDVTGPHTHGPGPITSRLFKPDVRVNSRGSYSPPESHLMSHSPPEAISNALPQEHSSDGNTDESSDMIVHDFLRPPSMAAAHDLGTGRSMISGMASGRAQASGTVQFSNLLNEAHRRGSLGVPQVPGRVPVESSIRNRQAVQRGEFMEEARPHIPILRFEEEILEGRRHSFDFNSANGIHQDDTTTVEHVPGGPGECDKAIVRKTGSFTYIAPDGQRITTSYVADENGYRVRGDHLPTPPPIPEAIQRSLDELRSKGRL